MSSAAIALREQYSQPQDFIKTFAPAKQYEYCTEVRRCFMGRAPQLRIVSQAFNKGTTIAWLAFHLRDLSEFSGCKDKLSTSQINDIAEVIFSQFAHLKVTELMYFFLLFKSGKFGRFYGAVDGLKIMEALREFCDMRDEHISRYVMEEEKRKQAEEDAKREAEFALLKQRYRDRVPDAFTDKALINFSQYQMLRYDKMSDDELNADLELIKSGQKTLPTRMVDMLTYMGFLDKDQVEQ